MRIPDERLALLDDPELGVLAEPDPATVQRHVGRYVEACQLVRQHRPQGGLYVDLGCGTGYGAEVAAPHASHYAGVDASAMAVAYAERHHSGPGRSWHWATHRTWPLATEPLGQGAPQVVLCIEMYEHLAPREQAALLYRVARFMDPAGLFVLMCPLGSGGPSTSNPWHLYEPTERELAEQLARHFRHWWVHVGPVYTNTAGQQARQLVAVASRQLDVAQHGAPV